MKNLKHYLGMVLTLTLASAVLFSACSPKQEEGAVVPKNAVLVVTANVGSLWKKGELDKADRMNSVQSLRQQLQQNAPELDELVGAVMADPSSCGLDLGRDLLFFYTLDLTEHFGSKAVLSAWVKDQKQFDDFLSRLDNEAGLGLKSSKEGDLTVSDFGGGLVGVSNGERVLFVIPTADGQTSKAMSLYAASLFELKHEESMASMETFATFLGGRKDINLFYPYSGLLDGSGSMGLDIFPKEDLEALKKTAVCCYGSFEQGSIEFTSTTLNMPENMKAILDHDVNRHLLDFVPGSSLIVLSFNVDLHGLMDYFAKTEMLDPEQELMDDLTPDDIADLLGGSMVICLHGYASGMPLVTAALDIADADAADDLLDELGFDKGANHIYTIKGNPLQVFCDGKVAVATTDGALLGRILKDGAVKGFESKAPLFTKGNGFYMDLNLEDYPAELLSWAGLVDNPVATLLFGLFDHVESYSVNHVESMLRIVMADDKSNSLAYILQTLDAQN